MTTEKAVVQFDPDKGFLFTDLDSMYRAAECFLQSGFSPRGFTSPQQLIICWARAAELGIKPLQAVEGMHVINGRLGIGGDLALAKVRSMGLLVSTPKKVYSGTIGQDDYTCTVTLHRRGEDDPQDFSFSIREAKQSGIYKNNWPLFPQRMTYYRALGFGLRDMFSDVLKGMYTSEELEDFPDDSGWKSDEAKIAANQAAEDKAKVTGAKFVKATPGSKRPSPAEAAEPAFEEDKAKPAPAEPRSTPAFAKKLTEEQTQAAVAQAAQGLATSRSDYDDQMKDTVVAQNIAKREAEEAKQFEAEEREEAITQEESDELDMGPVAAAPTEPEWKTHVIRSIPHERFLGKKIGDLDKKDLLKVETQWIPKVEANMDDASDDQKLEYKLFQSAIADAKMAKPF